MEIDEKNVLGIAYLQLHDDILRIDFSLFHYCVEKALGRPVFTHEFGSQGTLRLEIRNVWDRHMKLNKH